MGTITDELRKWRTWQWRKAITTMVIIWIVVGALLLFAVGMVFLTETYGKVVGLLAFFFVVSIFMIVLLASSMPQDEP